MTRGGCPGHRFLFMRANYKIQRLFVSKRLAAGEVVPAAASQHHYLTNVLRMDAGDKIQLFNGCDGEWLARLEPRSRKQLDFIVGEQVRSQPEPGDLVYCFAPLKQARLDYMVQKAVEMGAGRLQPVLTQHTQMHRISGKRLAANVVEAAEQCGILTIPEVSEAIRFDNLLAAWDPERRLIFCDEAHGSQNPLPALKAIREKRLAVLIGPEGGFSDRERERLQDCSFVTAIPLGPRILRADTAAVAALAVVQAAIGDWN